MKIKKTNWDGIYWIIRKRKEIATLNSTPGFKVYDENIVKKDKKEYRIWNPTKSKLAAAILKGLKLVPLKENYSVLYLGASTGTTVSHISDILKKGVIYAVEFAPRVLRELIFVAKVKKNIMPILESASFPEKYGFIGKVNLVYQDIAQKDQTRIFVKNCNEFLVDGGYGIICVKSRSIDVAKKPNVIYAEVEKELKKHFKIIDKRKLDPYEKDHMLFLIKK